MAKARAIEGLGADQPYAEAAVQIVEVRAAEVAEHSHGILDTDDIERVHDMRVATRRLRAALEIFGPCFPRRLLRPALSDVKRLADALGERRDRDVAIAALARFGERMPAADVAGIGSLVAELRREQVEANEALAALVTEERMASLIERMRELIAESRGRAEVGTS
jgi:CHAD domain-containing protein